MTIRVATFNAHNLFARYRFADNKTAFSNNGFTIDKLAFDFIHQDSKEIAGQTIRAINADIICLQEVENLRVLEAFNNQYLKGVGYNHLMLIDGHDKRAIDVAVLSKYQFSRVSTHIYERSKNDNGVWLFSRDCLEVDFDINGNSLSLYVNHFKSMYGGRSKTNPRRQEQSQRVVEIIDESWRRANYKGNFILLGDLNDFIDERTGLAPIVNHPELVNVVERLPKEEQWTHFYGREDTYNQLDYLFLSKILAEKNQNLPVIFRKGMARKAKRYKGKRFKNVGDLYPAASDHAAVYMDIELL